MLSTRSLYSNEVEFYRRSDQRGMSLGHTSSLGDQYDTNSQLSRNNSPQSDPENKSAPPRKRVPVACGRCRKRKIKCSGDEGGNRGCSNCRNAGFAGCQFLRVQSSILPMGVPYQALKGWQMSHRFSPYSTGVSSRFKPFTGSQYTDTAPYGGLPTAPSFDSYQTPASTCSWVRPSYTPHYGLTYSDEPVSHYGNQQSPPSYMLPNTDPMNNTNSCYLNNSLARVQQVGLWTDPASSVSMTPTMASAGGGNINTSYGLQGTDTTSSFHATSTSSIDRTLPTPSASRTLAAAPQSSLDSHCLSALSHRSSLSWNIDTPSSTSGASSRTSNSTDSDSRVVSTTPFGFIDVSSSAHELADTTAGIEISQSSHDIRRSSDDSRIRTVCRESSSLVPSPTDAMDYPYISGRGIRNHHSTSGRLTTGHLYQPVPPPSNARSSIQQDCSPTLQDLNQEGTWQNHSQRSSLASLSNSSSFSNIH